jgi:hypothetical protein
MYGSIPNMNDSSHASTIVMYPSFNESCDDVLLKIIGNAPVRKVRMQLISNGVNPLSKPYAMDMMTDRSMNNALMSNALPTFIDMSLIIISISR